MYGKVIQFENMKFALKVFKFKHFTINLVIDNQRNHGYIKNIKLIVNNQRRKQGLIFQLKS